MSNIYDSSNNNCFYVFGKVLDQDENKQWTLEECIESNQQNQGLDCICRK